MVNRIRSETEFETLTHGYPSMPDCKVNRLYVQLAKLLSGQRLIWPKSFGWWRKFMIIITGIIISGQSVDLSRLQSQSDQNL